jgi:hypothetical protein
VEADPTHPIPEHPIPEPSSAAAERALAQALEASPKTEQIPAKKSKSKRKIVEPGAVNSDASAVGTINGEQLDTEKVVKQEQVKKSKKRKSKEENGDAPLVSVDGLREAEDCKKDKKGKTRIAGTEAEGEDGNVSANGVGNGDGKKHKKAKKEKSRIDGLGKVTSNGALAPTLGDGIEGNEVEKPSKKVKKEKRKRYDEPETSANGASSCKNVVEAAHGDQVDPAKKPKKSKKIKSDVDCNGDDVAPSNSLEDILADPELSDQAKKGPSSAPI